MEIFSKQTKRLPGLWLCVVRNASVADMRAKQETVKEGLHKKEIQLASSIVVYNMTIKLDKMRK